MVHELQFLLGHFDAHFPGLVSFPNLFRIVAYYEAKSNEECPLQEYDKIVFGIFAKSYLIEMALWPWLWLVPVVLRIVAGSPLSISEFHTELWASIIVHVCITFSINYHLFEWKSDSCTVFLNFIHENRNIFHLPLFHQKVIDVLWCMPSIECKHHSTSTTFSEKWPKIVKKSKMRNVLWGLHIHIE